MVFIGLRCLGMHCIVQISHTVIVVRSYEAVKMIGKRPETSSTETEVRGEGRLVNLKLHENSLHGKYKDSISKHHVQHTSYKSPPSLPSFDFRLSPSPRPNR